jgi:ferredoxin, 2Fe-2S
MPTVTYIDTKGTRSVVEVPVGENVMRGALYNGVDGILGECGGGLACATCHCYVDDAWAEKAGIPKTKEEREMLESVTGERKATSRLSCQIDMSDALDGLVVHLPESQF